MSAGFKGRREDLRLVTGQGKYTSDWNLHGQLYGSFLRSDRAHAEIASIDTGPALASPGVLAVLTGLAIYKPVQFAWLTWLFGGFQAARYWHFWAVWIFIGFTAVHVALVFLVDPASLRAMLTGWYRGRFPSHD